MKNTTNDVGTDKEDKRMSQILIPRFESISTKKDTTVMVGSDKTVIVKDHATDKNVIVVNYAKTAKENMAIAELFIEVLESYIESDGDGD